MQESITKLKEDIETVNTEKHINKIDSILSDHKNSKDDIWCTRVQWPGKSNLDDTPSWSNDDEEEHKDEEEDNSPESVKETSF